MCSVGEMSVSRRFDYIFLSIRQLSIRFHAVGSKSKNSSSLLPSFLKFRVTQKIIFSMFCSVIVCGQAWSLLQRS